MWSSCPHLDLVNRAACQNDHTWCPSSSESVSPLNLSTPFWNSLSTPLLAHIHTKGGRAKPRTRNVHSLSHLVLKLSLNFPKVFLFFSAVPSACSSHKDPVHSPASFTYWGKERGGAESTLAQPAAPSFPRVFPHPSTDLRFVLDVLWNHSGVEEIKGWSTSLYLALDVWSGRYFPRCFSLFFMKWSCDVNWDVGTQANRLDCGKREKEVIFKTAVCRTESLFAFLFYFQRWDKM